MFIVNTYFKSLQGRDSLIVEQNDRVAMCSDDFRSLISVFVSSNSASNMHFQAAISDIVIQTREHRVATKDGIIPFVESISSIAINLFGRLSSFRKLICWKQFFILYLILLNALTA